ncbi:hypothetical protein Acr_19g0008880 [Actinidia rufa]|uniref:CUE domain-containing protein n=1 Tax=Actinidia rufa TaxID=165716 RepID=A0A7J0GB17_9ERIC|nr:hypothetical protein Acr_19g0008880 [Actinidia rufa]
MSAIVCGKRSFFEDLPASPQSASPPVSKRLRCSNSTSPVRFSPFSLIDQLRVLFPDMDNQLLERALDECGYDLNAAIKSLHELSLGYAAGNPDSAEKLNANREKDMATTDEDTVTLADHSVENNLNMDGAEWVDFFVREMMSATSIDDARSRATRVTLLRENTILKRAVAIQHERQKEYDERNQEVQHLKHLVSQYQEQLRTLEVNNYALTMHLQQTQQRNSFPGRFNPDVF